MPTYVGSCYCNEITYKITLSSPDEARTSICHCRNCRKWFGSAYGITTKIPLSSLQITSGTTTKHESDNGSGTNLFREFCGTCGSGILEYGEHAKGEWRYVTYGTLDEKGQEELKPKGEFFCKSRREWVQPVPGAFQKREIKE
ncbi:DUF636 domain protein [Sphaerosporella brunnea]|uniref:DUF636 domain protein n=1 Tax=Sphaerosporella brunnea TaxID=1250544 RepID=A0A5J5END3_9PEZI|nr:DUF636 domain protein [Sphaerosporella brunnea]